MNTDNQEKKDIPAWKVFGSAILIWMGASALPYVYGFWHPSADYGIEQRGQIGDMFGFTNSIFSSLAFAALIYTIYLQRKDLAVQRTALNIQKDDLKATHDEMKRSATAQENAELALRGQLDMQFVSVKLSAVTQQIEHYRDHFKKQMTYSDEDDAVFTDRIITNLVDQQGKLLDQLAIDRKPRRGATFE